MIYLAFKEVPNSKNQPNEKKRKNMKKILALTLPLLLTAFASRADLIYYEGFNYPNGAVITNTTLWTKNGSSGGSANPSDAIIFNHAMQVSTTGNAITSRQDDVHRYISLTNGCPYTNAPQLIYASFTVICTNLPNGYSGRVLAYTNGTLLPNTWRLAANGNTSAGSSAPANGGYPVDLALNTPYQVVEEFDPVNLKAATIWINPLNIYQTGSAPTETHYTSSDSIGFASTTAVDSFAFRQASSFGNGFWTITNLALATTFAEAATNIWKTNAFAPLIVYQPVGNTNFVGASISLSAVASAQGLGNVTYNWLQNGTPYPNGNGTNILAISSAATTDSGNYTLVVTTPYGLSVTSAVAKVLISAAPVPPAFVTQPGSQKAYKGQTVTLSTTVSSPGNIFYTWYSNNVVVSSTLSPGPGQTDNGSSSSYTLTGVQTNYSASYKVAVTNDVVPTGGVVSTNAVLTVLNPSAVTIAYLRTLVDPNNGYNPTNTPPSIPYQVTGTITTFTNTTTGTTASYYLQDGTAGIDIFVTGDSTFRPAQGDVVTFTGVLSSYIYGLELDADVTTGTAFPYTSYFDTGLTNALPTPITIGYDVATNLNNLNYKLEGSLVTIKDVYFGTNAGYVLPTTANFIATITNSSGQSFNLSFFDLDQDTAGQTLPSYAYTVTGVLFGLSTNANYSVAVTRFADIVTTAPLTPIPLGLTVSGGSLTFNWTDPSFSLQAATNVTGPYTTVTGATSGYITNTTSGAAQFFRLYHP
jgi:hypothetical protein